LLGWGGFSSLAVWLLTGVALGQYLSCPGREDPSAAGGTPCGAEKYFLFLYDLEVDAQQLWIAGNHEKLLSKAD